MHPVGAARSGSNRVPLPDDAADHRVVVTLGEARAKQEAPRAVGW